MAGFNKLYFHVGDTSEPGSLRPPAGLESAIAGNDVRSAAEPAVPLRNWNDERAARFFMDALLEQQEARNLRDLAEPERPELMPNLRLEQTTDQKLTESRLLKFSQTNRAVPIFGGEAIVELNGNDRRLVSVEANLADPPQISATATISPQQALESVAEYCDVPSSQVLENDSAPAIMFYWDEGNEKWHLVYHCKSIQAVPPEQSGEDGHRGHGLGPSPRELSPHYDFLVDAHDASVVFYFSSQPQLDVPSPCSGNDDEGVRRDFLGLNTGTAFQLIDTLRNIETYDFAFGDINTTTPPTVPIQHTASDFASTSPAGVSAHYYATKVFDFYNDVLKRSGVDDRGMKLVSLVNVTYPAQQPPPNWNNAVWWDNKMWYGQIKNGTGAFESYARYFDVIAHELTHGITENTADLVYRNQSGALNESFSDIFGVMIRNWYPNEPNPIASWNWEIGSGLGGTDANGNPLPLRDMRDPTRTGDPDHMNNFLNTVSDNGGVHTNSNIHNKAAFNVLTATDGNGAPQFSASETAILYYLTLTRLTRLSNFSDCLRVLKGVTGTYFSGNPTVQAQKKQAIVDAYQSVGIT